LTASITPIDAVEKTYEWYLDDVLVSTTNELFLGNMNSDSFINTPAGPNSIRLKVSAESLVYNDSYDLTTSSVGLIGANKLLADDRATEDWFGCSVAIDGKTAIVGTHEYEDTGCAYIFTKVEDKWTQTSILFANDAAANDNFGWSVAIDDNIAIIGALGDSDNGSYTGSAYIFTKDGENWIQTRKLVADDAATGDNLGWSVSIDGDSAIVGAFGNDDKGSSSGSAYIFTKSEDTWSQTQKLIANDGAAGDLFGRSVSIDGALAIVGAYGNGDSDNGTESGSAYIFTKGEDTWSQTIKLIADDAAANDRFGWSVSIDGASAIVGAFGDGSYSGSAYAFSKVEGNWIQTRKLVADDADENDRFGWSVAIDENIAIIGAYGNDTHTGSAYLYRIQ